MQPQAKTGTPSDANAVHLETWLHDLANDDDKVSGSARRRLVARGNLGVERLMLVLEHPQNVAHYRAALRVLGGIARAGHLQPVAVLRRLLLAHLKQQDGASRRSVITCLGHLGVDPQTELALLEFWRQENRDDQLRVLAAALGGVGGAGGALALETCASRAPLVLREAAKARAAIHSRQLRATGGEGRVLADKVLPGLPVRLRCRSGLGGLLMKNLPASVRHPRQTAPGQIDGELHGSLNSLLQCRLWSEAVLHALTPRGLAAPEAFAATLAGHVGAWMRSFTDGPATWRLHLPAASRGELLDFIRAAQRTIPDLPNSPSRAVWELRPLANEIELRTRFWMDTRFTYLGDSVPAMTHAPLAAALVALSQPRPDDVVWDPFCGAGTELGERAKAGPYARLIGSDRDHMALTVARRNLHGVERLALHHGNSLNLRFDGVNVILTNPPYGRKVQGGNIALLLRGLLEKAGRDMPTGRIVWCSPLPRETWNWARELGWKGVARHAVGADGHIIEAQVFARP